MLAVVVVVVLGAVGEAAEDAVLYQNHPGSYMNIMKTLKIVELLCLK